MEKFHKIFKVKSEESTIFKYIDSNLQKDTGKTNVLKIWCETKMLNVAQSYYNSHAIDSSAKFAGNSNWTRYELSFK